uniref:Uncharacterized protein n=1 Tax=Acrobeloides nanus TaxID=290746 RepID=A0A914C0P9_9BILA
MSSRYLVKSNVDEIDETKYGCCTSFHVIGCAKFWTIIDIVLSIVGIILALFYNSTIFDTQPTPNISIFELGFSIYLSFFTLMFETESLISLYSPIFQRVISIVLNSQGIITQKIVFPRKF